MGIRIQPKDIDVPKDDPFINDRFDRKKSVEALTHLLNNFDSPCVLAVDAIWGNGKTTFLKMWSSHLKAKEFHIIQFNAWETDYSDDPFIVVVEELLDSISTYIDNLSGTDKNFKDKLRNSNKELINLAKDIILCSISGLVRCGTAGILDPDKLMGNNLDSQSSVEKRQLNHQDAKKSFREFKETLAITAKLLSQSNDNKPFIIMIDELDRCRPTYAVELLEVTKHLFAVDRLIFVMAVNCSQLEHSVKSLYGVDFDAEGYLKRFFDLKFQLPVPKRNDFIEQLLTDSGIFHYRERTDDHHFGNEFQMCRELLYSFSENSNFSHRTLAQTIHHLGLVFASLPSNLPSNRKSFAFTTVALLIIRTMNIDSYRSFIGGNINDRELIEELLNTSSVRNWEKIKHIDYVEALLILSYFKRPGSSLLDETDTPLRRKYRKILARDGAIEEIDEIEKTHAERVTKAFDSMNRNFSANWRDGGFTISVERIELFSEEYSAFYTSDNDVNG